MAKVPVSADDLAEVATFLEEESERGTTSRDSEELEKAERWALACGNAARIVSKAVRTRARATGATGFTYYMLAGTPKVAPLRALEGVINFLVDDARDFFGPKADDGNPKIYAAQREAIRLIRADIARRKKKKARA